MSGPKRLAQFREHADFVKTPIDSLAGEDVLLSAWPDKSARSIVRNTPRVFGIEFTEQCDRLEHFFGS